METNSITLSEIIKDKFFIKEVDKLLLELKEKRWKREPPKPGFYYKRDWFDRMNESYKLTPNYFIENILAIWNKKSLLSSEYRSVIEFVCNQALKNTIEHYEALNINGEKD